MKRNFGNGIVRKSIVLAMAAMLAMTTPSINVLATESTSVATDVAPESKDISDSSTVSSNDSNLSKEESDLVNNIHDGLLNVNDNYVNTESGTYNPYEVVDKAAEIVETEVDKALDKEITDANTATSDAQKAVTDAENTYTNIDNYESVTDELLHNDETLAESAVGNTDKIVERITEEGQILINTEDKNGTQTTVSVEVYTKEKADIVLDATKTAEESLNNILNSSDVDVATERAKVEEALKTAEIAKTEATTAYSAATSVLLEEIKRYNAYASAYGLDLYVYTDENGTASTPCYTAEELANIESLNGISMNSDTITSELNKINTNDLSTQLNEIKAAERLVTTCGVVVAQADNAIEKIKAQEEHLVSSLTNMKTLSENALKTVTDENERAALTILYEGSKKLLDDYQRDFSEDSSVSVNEGSYEDVFEKGIEKAYNLADTIETLVANASIALYGTETMEGAVSRFNTAYAEYAELKKEYDSYIQNKQVVDSNFAAIEAKLKAAEQAVSDAKINLNTAIDAFNRATEIKKQFDNINTDSSSSVSGGSVSSTTDNTTTISDDVTALDATLEDEPTPLIAGIMDEQVPLTDSVPTTGDSTAAASVVGATGFLAILSAFFLHLKKRTLR